MVAGGLSPTSGQVRLPLPRFSDTVTTSSPHAGSRAVSRGWSALRHGRHSVFTTARHGPRALPPASSEFRHARASFADDRNGIHCRRDGMRSSSRCYLGQVISVILSTGSRARLLPAPPARVVRQIGTALKALLAALFPGDAESPVYHQSSGPSLIKRSA